MRTTLMPAVSCFLLSLLVMAPNQAAATLMFSAALDGAQEVPLPTGSAATGMALLELNDAQTRLEISIQLNGLDLDGLQTASPDDDVVGLHIHRGGFGVNGPVVFGFIGPNNDLNADLLIDPLAGLVTSAWDLNEGNATTLAAELPSLFSEGLYFNVHTPAFPAGEIRGQILQVPEPAMLGLMGIGLAGVVLARCRKQRF